MTVTSERLELRPMGVGDLLDTAFRLYRRHFFLFIGIVGVIYIPLTFFQTVYQLALMSSTSYLGDSSDLFLQFVVLIIGIFAVQGLMNGAMTRAVADRFLGRPIGLVDTYLSLGWRWLRLVAGLLVVGLIDLVILLLFLIPCLGWIAGFVLLVYINLPIFAFLAPVIVVEDQGVFDGLHRAFNLGRRKFWRLLGISLLLSIMALVIWAALFFLLTLTLSFWEPSFELVYVITQSFGLVVTLIVAPIGLCTFTLLYFDLRIRLEGFDLELMLQEMASSAPE